MTTEQQPKRQRFSQATVAVLALSITGLLMPFLASPARAVDSALFVDTLLDDPAASACTAAPTDCSLRGALINANADGVAEIETISVPAGTYDLTVAGDGYLAGSLNVTASVVLVGAGPASTIVDAHGIDRVLVVSGEGPAASRTLTASGFTFRGGRPCNEPGGGDDGGNLGGGGLFLHGVASLTDVIVEDNLTCGAGGGIYATQYASALTLTRTTIRANTALTGAGGVQSDFSLTMVDSTVSGNLASGSHGGGLRLAGTATITGSTISNNTATARGGGITTGDDTTSGCCAATVTITNSTISGNLSKYYNSGTPQYFPGSSGGVYIGRSNFTLRHVTLTGNVSQDNPISGAIGSGAGISGGYQNFLTVENSIIAGNVGSEECRFDGGTTYTSTGSFGCSTAGIQDPQLGPLADNGGLTQTHALTTGNPAVDAASAALCTSADQRGLARPSGLGCDMGAFELQAAPPTPEPTASPEPTPAPTQTPAPTPEPPGEPTPGPTTTPTEPPLTTPMPSAAPTAPPEPTSQPPGVPFISIDDATGVEGNAGTAPLTFTVRLSAPAESSVFVTARTLDGTARHPADYQLVGPVEIAFVPGATTATFEVPVVGDAVRELPETFSVELSSPFGGAIGRGTATGTIREPAFGPFDADAVGDAPANSYLLGVLSHYVYEDTAMGGTGLADFEAAFRARFHHPGDGLAVVAFFENAVTQVQGAIVETGDALIVVVRGTETPTWSDPANAIDLIVDGAAVQSGGIHAGFGTAAASVYGPVSSRASAARAAGKHVWVTGHSLGGSVASVLGFMLQTSGIEVQGIHTFGAPRAFSVSTALVYDSLFASRPTIRWVNDLDPITHVPPQEILDYAHVGRTYNIVPTGPGGTGCTVLADSAERLVGGDFDDHSTHRYLGRMYAGLASDAVRSTVVDPPTAPTAPFVLDGCDGVPATPQSFARDAFLAGRDVLQTAKALAYDYGLTKAELLAERLLAAGYSAKQVAIALKSVVRATAEIVIETFKTLRVALREIVVAVKEAFFLSVQSLARKLFRAGYTSATEVAIALRDGLGVGIDVVADALEFAGFPGRDAVAALQTAWAAGAQAVATALQAAGYAGMEVAIGLKAVYSLGGEPLARILRVAGYAAGTVWVVLQDLDGFANNLIAATLRGAGYFAYNIAEHLRYGLGMAATEAALVLKGAGFDATSVGEALVLVFQLGAEAVTRNLDRIKFTATEVMRALLNLFGLDANATADLMEQAGIGATAVLTALRDVFGQTATTGAAALAFAGYTASQVCSAMKSVFNTSAGAAAQIVQDLGYSALDAASALKAVFSRTGAQATTLLYAAGYAALDTAAALKSVYAATAAQATTWLKAAGYAVGDVAAALKSKFSRTAAQVTVLLRDAGYGVISVATGIKAAFNRSASQMIGLLADAGYGATAIANALRVAYEKTAADVGLLLWSAGFSIDQIITALRSAFTMTYAAVVSLLVSLGIM